MTTELRLAELAERWASARASERANAQSYLIELTEALGVERPGPAGTGYQFELPIRMVHRDGTESTGFADLYKEGCFLLEAKDEEEGRSTDLLLRRAFGQARGYVSYLPGELPPYILVLDVGRSLTVWDRWSGSYGGYNAGYRIDLTRLADRPEDVALLQDIWQDPTARDPSSRAEAVTREVAARLAELASGLEGRGHEQERVARFLMRVVFTMFAEDVDLLDDEPLLRIIEEIGFHDPDQFSAALEQLWQAMDSGGWFGYRKLLHFNGHFFRETEVLPLTAAELRILHSAAKVDWRDVEPAIFGTLLVRALDPVERHRLGAEYTPRAYVERLIRPTIEDPLRERWALVQAEVLQLRERGRPRDKKRALERLRAFHHELREIRVLDPACGSGNFLYIALDVMKRLELEVLREIEGLSDGQSDLEIEEINPSQFYGLEVKAWARELAELTLWIGYHQWWSRTHGGARPPEPVLKDTGTIEHRDAVLAWDDIIEDPARARPDPTPRIPHPVTGKLVPDPEAKLAYYRYDGAREAEWPEAEFIVGNPPYMGISRQRDAFGDGYVDALRGAYPEVPDSADFVMYWWHRAAREVAEGRTIRAGLITTNTITQSQNRVLLDQAAERGARVMWAVADHPWIDESDSAAVRVALTVIAREPASATLVEVDDEAEVVREVEVERLNADLTAHADVAAASRVALEASRGLGSRGFQLIGAGFILDPEEAERLLASDPRHAEIIKRYRNGRDLTSRPRGVYLIDFALLDEEEAREYPVLYDIVRTRVKPGRDANNRKAYRDYWWRFGEPRRELRTALAGLPRYIATPETSKHRFFTFLEEDIAPDNRLVCIGSDDAFHLGVLSSSIHITWALGAGGRLEDRPVYNKTTCFDPFPFPTPSPALRARIADLADRLDQHRKDALARDERVTLTGMYNVVEKLRTGEALTPTERRVHEVAACGVVLDLHNELDALVAEAYGWPWPLEREEILDRLVRLHAERRAEEDDGLVRWLRPEYQIPKFAPESAAQEAEELFEPGVGAYPVGAGAAGVGAGGLAASGTGLSSATGEVVSWPADALEQLALVRAAAAQGPVTAEEVAKQLAGARRDVVIQHLEALAIIGELSRDGEGRYHHQAREVVPAG